ncbi:DUF4329 domain-containing protein [Ruegeria jejuensis]|uniref:DUF4329 domain-containing protein n=1 Tax=Ruegeria jejuensis TaxID=3233338 RepID=UPI00355BCB82
MLLCVGCTVGPTQEEVAAVKTRFAEMQELSFETDLEYCGYLLRLPDGSLGFSQMVPGGHDGCTPELPQPGSTLLASMHTHGSYHPDVPAEFPTVIDIDSDRRERVNGFVATPGGRLWFIDSRAGRVTQLCGLNCLPQDPFFQPGDDGVIAQSYTRAELQQLERGF